MIQNRNIGKSSDNSSRRGGTVMDQLQELEEENEKLKLLVKKLYREKIEAEETMRRRRKIGIILMVIGVLLIGWFGYRELCDYLTARSLHEVQKERQQALNAGSKNGKQYIKANEGEILQEYKSLYQINSDLVGWIEIADTEINYPVVQSPDNQKYYLNHDFDGESDDAGAIFADIRNDVFRPDDDVILYGHNMKNGSMFGGLQAYLKQDYYSKHKMISFDTLFEKGKYEIIAVGLSKISDEKTAEFRYYDFLKASSKEDFATYMKKIKQLEVYSTGKTAKYGDKLITLSTCNSVEENGRLFIVAKKIG